MLTPLGQHVVVVATLLWLGLLLSRLPLVAAAATRRFLILWLLETVVPRLPPTRLHPAVVAIPLFLTSRCHRRGCHTAIRWARMPSLSPRPCRNGGSGGSVRRHVMFPYLDLSWSYIVQLGRPLYRAGGHGSRSGSNRWTGKGSTACPLCEIRITDSSAHHRDLWSSYYALLPGKGLAWQVSGGQVSSGNR